MGFTRWKIFFIVRKRNMGVQQSMKAQYSIFIQPNFPISHVEANLLLVSL